MSNIDIRIAKEGDDFTLYFHPESLALMTYDLKQEGLSDKEIVTHIEELKSSILADYKQKLESGEIDEDEFEEGTGCGDPSCPNCGTAVVYH